MSTTSSASSLFEHQPLPQQEQQQTGPTIRLVPNLGMDSRSYVFEVIERTIPPGMVYKMGRHSDRNSESDRLSFKSKVVSRTHAELWVDENNKGKKIYLRDTGSSSGTFVNRVRLSHANVPSGPQEIKDGDLVQLGVNYQGGVEPMYRAVRIRVEINRDPPTVSQAFREQGSQQLRQHLVATGATAPTAKTTAAMRGAYKGSSISITGIQAQSTTTENGEEVQECCICLYAIAPLQALFISPCSHIFHFKCLHPILIQNYPGFACPICRTYSNLESSVTIEASEVLEAIGINQEPPQEDNGNGDEPHCDNTSLGDIDEERGEPTGFADPYHLRTLTAGGGRTADEVATTLVATPPNFEGLIHEPLH